MKGIIFYYSGSGNTKLACDYISKKNNFTDFTLTNIVKVKDIEIQPYHIVGFATFTDFLGPPFLFQKFIEQLPNQNGKYAFTFNTYGSFPGKTLKTINKLVIAKGFDVLIGHSLHTPESYPPMIVKRMSFKNSPNKRQIKKFELFIKNLNDICSKIANNEAIERKKIKIGIFNSLFPTTSRERTKKAMGEKFVDESLCKKCGLCEKTCPYNAINLNPFPHFDESKCYGCWACFNHCPSKAIYTKKIRGKGHYPKPIPQYVEKFKIKNI